MSFIEFRLEGSDRLEDALAKIARRIPVVAAKGMNEIAELTMTASKELVPVKTGRLRNTGFVQHATPKGMINLVATLNYGTDYALAVHEIPPPPKKSTGGRSARHQPPYGTGGQWKYLEVPHRKASKTFGEDMARFMRNELKKHRKGG
jgi:hypothetical protein